MLGTLLISELSFVALYITPTHAATDIFRTTTYELQASEFTGTSYTLGLNNNLLANYFVMVSGGSSDIDSRAPSDDMVRVSADPHGNFSSSTGANQIELTRGASINDWVGALTIVECQINCTTSGFELSEVLETSLATGAANVLQTTNDTLSTAYDANTVPMSGRFGGGFSTSGTDVNAYSVTGGFKVSKTSGNQLQFDRFGAETRVPAAGTVTSYIVHWGSEWNIQSANVTGTANGTGIDATTEYDSAAITSVARDNTWVWSSGFTRDDGLGDGAFGQATTLGDGVAENATETSVSVGNEGGLVAPGRDFEVYVLEHASLDVDHRFLVRGNQGATSGFQQIDQTVDAAIEAESYDNASTSVQTTEGHRVPLFYNTSAGTGQAYSRVGAWGLRANSSTNLTYWRPYAGQPVSGWFQMIDFGDMTFSNVDTRQHAFRWRDDSTDLGISGGWLAAENTNLLDQAKMTSLRLRFSVANFGTTAEDAARRYELQFGVNTSGNCSAVSTWVGVSDSAVDDFELYDSAHIVPDGEITTSSILSNPGSFTYVNGEGREGLDTTNAIGPMADSAYSELEFAIRPTNGAVTGSTYCFRLFDTTAADELDQYTNYPELTMESTAVLGAGLGEAGTFASAIDGGWTTINFTGSYTDPVVVGTTNTHNGQSALVFESRNITSVSAEMRVCESEGSTANGCDTHASETVGYLIVDAAVASSYDGVDAGKFTINGRSDVDNVTTAFTQTFGSTPNVFANVNTVNSAQSPTEVIIISTSVANFNAGICDHLQGSVDECDGAHVNETVGWVAIEPGAAPFTNLNDSGTTAIANSVWSPISFTTSFASTPVLIAASQTDLGGQDVEIDEARLVTTTGADVRSCEIDTLDVCDTHNGDTMAWYAIEPGVLNVSAYYDQDGFRFYENINNATPSTALGSEDTNITGVDNGAVLRLRTALQAGDSGAGSGLNDFKLQFSQAADCSVAAVWSDVGSLGSGVIWRGFNNASIADGIDIPSSLLDGGVNSLQSYVEENDSPLQPNPILSGANGEWDWTLENNGAANFSNYCFRVTTSAGDLLNYTYYPSLITSTGVVNIDPGDPTGLDQRRTDTSVISVGQVINDTTVVFVADISDGNANDIIQLCVEVDEIGNAFSDVEGLCGATVVYSGSAIEATVTVPGFVNSIGYHWQVRVKDAANDYSAWVSFGGNSEAAVDFEIDTVAPVINIFDGSAVGVDIEFNGGELNELSANWEKVDGSIPTDLTGNVLWLDGDDVDGSGTDPANGSAVSTWTDKSGAGNDIDGTGDAVFDDSRQAIAFSDDVQPFDDTYDRSGGDANSQTIFAVVEGNASVSNHVWFETTTPRVAPAENGLLGGGTSLTSDNIWSSHISTQKMITLEYLSGGTSTAWLDRLQEYQFSETPAFADSQQLIIGDDTTGGNRLESGEYVNEIIIYNQDLSQIERESVWEYLECKWAMKDCSVTYEYSIGTSPDGTDIVGWTATGITSFTESGLNLETSEVYYVNVRASDVAGNQVVINSDGQQVAPTITFTTGVSGVTFDDLNYGNGFEDTETATLTTSTNARNGYVIRSYAAGVLTNANLDTVGMFDGGTYASPDEWMPGDTGYGYTSSDSLIEGVNKFSPGICAGGGSGPCFAPFSTTAPGDIVADNPGIISGTPITAEQFTITHRARTTSAQNTGVYQTYVIYNATAVY